jgi:hypothetical protein
VLIDAVVLTPALEKANARLGIEQAVTAVVRQAGWEPVSVTTDCKDLACAGAAATAAKAPYSIVLTGRFVKQETYVADIGVSLSRDGTAVASRSEADEEASARRTGATFVACGPPSGVCTTKLLIAKLQQYTKALLEDENVAIRVRRRVAAAAPPPGLAAPAAPSPPPPAGVSVTPSPAPASPGPAPDRSRRSRVLGWSFVIGGAVLVGGGVALWALDDKSTDCHSVAGDPDNCRARLQTRPAAIVTGLAGVAAAGVGVAVLRWGKGEGQVALSVRGNGLSVGGKF